MTALRTSAGYIAEGRRAYHAIPTGEQSRRGEQARSERDFLARMIAGGVARPHGVVDAAEVYAFRVWSRVADLHLARVVADVKARRVAAVSS